MCHCPQAGNQNLQFDLTEAMKNLFKLYYQDYYRGDIKYSFIDGDVAFTTTGKKGQNGNEGEKAYDFSGKNKQLLGTPNDNEQYLKTAKAVFLGESCLTDNEQQTFILPVSYPGLITGIGIEHDAGIKGGEFKLGIHLDYTTGLPVIYGSTVKGTLRSAFNETNLFDILSALIPDEKKRIDEIKKKLGATDMKEWQKVIFGNDEESLDHCSPYCRDIFFDAVIEELNVRGYMLSPDTIAPHNDGPLKNPVPVSFVKIAPGCKIKFRFRLVDSGTLSSQDKCDLFRYILLAFGIGAKTNVGYGQFD